MHHHVFFMKVSDKADRFILRKYYKSATIINLTLILQFYLKK